MGWTVCSWGQSLCQLKVKTSGKSSMNENCGSHCVVLCSLSLFKQVVVYEGSYWYLLTDIATTQNSKFKIVKCVAKVHKGHSCIRYTLSEWWLDVRYLLTGQIHLRIFISMSFMTRQDKWSHCSVMTADCKWFSSFSDDCETFVNRP